MTPKPLLDTHRRRLEEAIRKAMMECPAIREVISDLSDLGYAPDVWLVMGISLIKQNGPGIDSETFPFNSAQLTPEDIHFIRSIDVRWNNVPE
ncbi:MAG TPA: hypothetical protein PLV45_09310 [bacterium]|nr:hypothetical protein [bacterium]